jgi:phosphate uptake regulator
MLREFISIFRAGDSLGGMGESFARMLSLTCEMTSAAGDMYFHGTASPDERSRIYQQDVEVNQLQRAIRKQVVAHLALRRNQPDVPYCLFLMSLVKDVERLGDYAKNLTEVMDFRAGPLPDDEIVAELRSIRSGVESAFREAAEVFAESDRDRALTFIREGRDMGKRCDALIRRIATGSYDGPTTAALILGARYYKRIWAHVLNVLSSVVMPVHKLDYFDEDEISRQVS